MWDILFAAIFIICIVSFKIYGFCYFIFCAGIAKVIYAYYGLTEDQWMMITVILNIVFLIMLLRMSHSLKKKEENKLNAMTDNERREYLRQKQEENQRQEEAKRIKKEQKNEQKMKRKEEKRTKALNKPKPMNQISYGLLIRCPETYLGQIINFSGKITRIINKDDNYYYVIVNVSHDTKREEEFIIELPSHKPCVVGDRVWSNKRFIGLQGTNTIFGGYKELPYLEDV